MFNIRIVSAQFLQPNPASQPDTLDAELSLEVIGATEIQGELLEFLLNANSLSTNLKVGKLPNGHEGIRISFSASSKELELFRFMKEATRQAKEALPGASELAINELAGQLFTKKLQEKEAAKPPAVSLSGLLKDALAKAENVVERELPVVEAELPKVAEAIEVALPLAEKVVPGLKAIEPVVKEVAEGASAASALASAVSAAAVPNPASSIPASFAVAAPVAPVAASAAASVSQSHDDHAVDSFHNEGGANHTESH